jgi:very-short-patch-repair endonuclease
VDFECRRSRVIVEVDGTQHGFDANRDRDMVRDENLRRTGYQVLRFANLEIDRELEAVMQVIFSALESARPTRLGASHLATLPSGEG